MTTHGYRFVADLVDYQYVYRFEPSQFGVLSLEDGAQIHWSDLKPLKPGGYGEGARLFVSPYLSYGDYDNSGSVERSNVAVFLEEFSDRYGVHEVYGSYGSNAVALRLDISDKEIIDVLVGLDDYPIISEDHMSELELERDDEAWESFVRSDFESALERRIEVDLSEADDDVVREYFEFLREAANTYWEDDGSGRSVDVARVVAAADREHALSLPGALDLNESSLNG